MNFKILMLRIFVNYLLLQGVSGLIWGGWTGDRTAGDAYELIQGSLYDEVRFILYYSGASVSSQLTSLLTTEYLNTINVFFTGCVYNGRSDLTTLEQEALVGWVHQKGGILFIAGCYNDNYVACRSFIEPFGLDVQNFFHSGNVISTCSGPHDLLDGVDELFHTNAELFIFSASEPIALCSTEGGSVTDVLLKSGNGYVLFSNMFAYSDSYISYNDNKKFFANFVVWTEQLESDVEPSDVDPSEVEPSGVGLSDVPSGVEPSDVEPSDVEPSDVEPSDTEPNEVGESVPEHCEIDCDDGNACTIDYCNMMTGCQHENPEVCYPTLTENAERLQELEIMMRHMQDYLIVPSLTFHPTPSPTHSPSSSPSETPIRAISLPTLSSTSNPSNTPTSTPTQIPVADIMQELLQNAVENIQNFVENQIRQMDEHITQIDERVGRIEESVEKLVSTLHPTPTQIPSSLPTPLPTLYPTREPDCTSEEGRWSSDGRLSLSFTTSMYPCCFLCHETENCVRWHYLDEICVLSEEQAMEDNVNSGNWRRGTIKIGDNIMST